MHDVSSGIGSSFICQMTVYVPRKLTSLSHSNSGCMRDGAKAPLNSTGGRAHSFLRTDAQSHSLSFIQRPAIHQCAHCCHEQRDGALSKSPLTQIWFTSICLKEWRARARSANTGWHLVLPTGMCLFSSVSNPGLMLKSDLLKDGIGLHRGWSYENELWSTMLLWNARLEGMQRGTCVCARACLHILAGKKWIFIKHGETENPALPLIPKRVVLHEHKNICKKTSNQRQMFQNICRLFFYLRSVLGAQMVFNDTALK